jgi:hypothetical protein
MSGRSAEKNRGWSRLGPGGRGSDRLGRRCCLGRLRHSNRFHQ